MDYKKIFFFSLFFLCVTIMSSQDNKYEIIGKVIDVNNNTSIEGANIFIINLKKNLVVHKTKSDSAGNFQISLDKGNYNISIGHVDYEVTLMPIDFSKFKNNSLNLNDIFLEPIKINELDEVVIVSKDFRIENRNNKRIYHIGNTLKDVAGSMSNLLSYIPSVSVDIDGTVQLRGKEPIVQINGRNSNLSKSEALQMLPSDMIKRIEVITRPSVKEGETEPIINIITDRKRRGTIGGVNFAIGLPSTIKGGLHLALNKEKINGYGLYGINNQNNIPSSKEESIRTVDNNVETVETETNDNNTSSTNQFGELQYEYVPNDKSELAGNVSVFNSNNMLSIKGERNMFSENFEQIDQLNDTENKLFSISTETEFEHQFNSEKEQLKIELEYEFESRKNSEMFLESSLSDGDLNTNSFDRLRSNEIELKTRYDWTLNNEGYFSLGYRFDLSTLNQEQFFSSDVNNISAENNIDFTQTDNTIYADYSNVYKKIYYNIGFRFVNTERKLIDEDTNESSKKSFSNLLPQINLEYEYGDSNEISLNYYSLLRQPRLNYLNSFNTSVDLQRIRVGNSELKPQSSQTIELELFNEFENSSISTTFSTNFVKDIIQNVSVFDTENNITVTRPENIGKSTTFGIDFSYSLNSPKWLNTIVKLNGRYGNISGGTIDDDFYRLNSSITNIVRLKSYKLELSWFFSPKNKINFQTFQSSNQYFKLGLSRRVLKNRGNLVLSVLDPFNSARIIQNIDGQNFDYRSVIRPNQRRVFLSLFWRFSVKSRFRNTDKQVKEKGILQ
ncbi:outer membrane beta-barrel family protein [Psychroserpens algicola]|uniref:outer membrane beta-barrel family protein n=1 Tax=Psychroserpens algicola TaxID=1719034 RepID=UPI001952CA3A|nr:outer membrane beta-barrel family protein [Psychroserpens algicola]